LNDASVALAARVVLAGVLTVSAVAKLRSRAAVQREIGALTSERFGALAGRALPALELVVAVALVVWWSPVPGLVALALFAVFTVALVRAQARHVPCACFGAGRSDAPPGPAAVVRNGVLTALAVLATGSPRGADLGPALLWCALFGVVTAALVRASGA
jgi:hypothetical protein